MTAVAGSTALLATTLAYFGHLRSLTLFLYFGVDQSLVSFTPQEYVIRSISVLFWPLFGATAASLLGVLMHGYADRARDSRTGLAVFRACWMSVLASAAVLLALAAVHYTQGRPLQPAGVATLYWMPLLAFAGAVGVGFGLSLMMRVERPRRFALPGTTAAIAGSLLIMLVALWGFWALSELATYVGRDRAVRLAGDLDRLPHVTVYAERGLALDGDGLSVTRVEEDGSQYAFVYEGLRLLRSSGDRFVLLPCAWSLGDPAIVVQAGDGLRLEFAAGNSGEGCTSRP